MKSKKPAKKRNTQDLTLRNLRAMGKRLLALDMEVADLRKQMDELRTKR